MRQKYYFIALTQDELDLAIDGIGSLISEATREHPEWEDFYNQLKEHRRGEPIDPRKGFKHG